jgi:protein-disulfide isomerase
MCILSYAINFMLVFYSWLIIRRFGEKEGIIHGLRQDFRAILHKKKIFLSWVAPFTAITVFVFAFFPVYWNLTPSPLSPDLPNGITEDGHPWIGGHQNPEIVITEYTDYLCFQCRKMHFFLRKIVERNPDKIRLIHRHYPMDHRFNPIVKEPFHIGSGEMSLLSVYASSQGKFWEMNDLLFGIDAGGGKIDINKLAEKTGLDAGRLSASRFDNNMRRKLWHDIVDGLKAGITGTPAYMIDGQLYLGIIPADILEKVEDGR